MTEVASAVQVVADYITSTTEDGVWSFEVWAAFQVLVAPLSHSTAQNQGNPSTGKGVDK
jgi:hypothetical protein